MTAEIAVLNKSAVALATDSAGTIGGGSGTKIYNTVNKIFELSGSKPVGIMIYGALDFMGLPIETLIKEYRKELGVRLFDTIEGYVDHFKSFLRGVPHKEQDEREQVYRMLLRPLRELNKSVDRAVLDIAVKEGKYKPSKVNGILQSQTRRIVEFYKSEPPLADFHSRRSSALIQNLQPVFQRAIDDALEMPTNATSISLLRKLCEEIIFRGRMSSVRTGIVIAGFGDKELCPSLFSIEIDGLIGGALKCRNHKSVDVGRYTVGADVMGFAQDDMVDRFLNGVDPAYNRFVSTAVKKLLANLVDDIQKNVPGATPATAAAFSAVFDKIKLDLDEDLAHYREVTFRQPTIDLVRFMPKPELAKLAESMIELTSLKRRVSWDQDTVGGEVDVAVISKSEGFVWIKRKHYFPRDLNPRFFHRLPSNQGGDQP